MQAMMQTIYCLLSAFVLFLTEQTPDSVFPDCLGGTEEFNFHCVYSTLEENFDLINFKNNLDSHFSQCQFFKRTYDYFVEELETYMEWNRLTGVYSLEKYDECSKEWCADFLFNIENGKTESVAVLKTNDENGDNFNLTQAIYYSIVLVVTIVNYLIQFFFHAINFSIRNTEKMYNACPNWLHSPISIFVVNAAEEFASRSKTILEFWNGIMNRILQKVSNTNILRSLINFDGKQKFLLIIGVSKIVLIFRGYFWTDLISTALIALINKNCMSYNVLFYVILNFLRLFLYIVPYCSTLVSVIAALLIYVQLPYLERWSTNTTTVQKIQIISTELKRLTKIFG